MRIPHFIHKCEYFTNLEFIIKVRQNILTVHLSDLTSLARGIDFGTEDKKTFCLSHAYMSPMTNTSQEYFTIISLEK